MDPISFLLTIWILWNLVKRAPDLAQDLADALRNGLDSAAYREQLRRLRAAGITPVRSGRLMGRVWGNAWREATHRLAGQRAAAASALGRQAGRVGRRLDDAAAAAADRIRRHRAGAPGGGGAGDGTAGGPVQATATVGRPTTTDPAVPALVALTAGPVDSPTGSYGGPARPVVAPFGLATATAGPADPAPVRAAVTTAPAVAVATAPAATVPAIAGGGGGTATAVLEGTIVPATPALPAAPAQRAIEGASPAMAVEVTGVASGAMEAQAIAVAVEMANQAYIAALGAVRQRITTLMDATLLNVEMQGNGAVMRALVSAGEAAAAAQAAARTCGSEVGPLMALAAAEFIRRS